MTVHRRGRSPGSSAEPSGTSPGEDSKASARVNLRGGFFRSLFSGIAVPCHPPMSIFWVRHVLVLVCKAHATVVGLVGQSKQNPLATPKTRKFGKV